MEVASSIDRYDEKSVLEAAFSCLPASNKKMEIKPFDYKNNPVWKGKSFS